MGWRVKKGAWYSPRAIKEPTSRVEEVKTGPNSVRYVAKREPSRLETKIQSPGLTYEDYKKQKNAHKPRRNAYAADAYNPDDYYGDQIVHRNSNLYAYTPSRWSSWGYGSFINTATDDDDDTLFVKEPPNYLTPTVDQIRAKCSYHSLKDMRRMKELARVCYLKMIDDRDFIAEDYKEGCSGRITPKDWEDNKLTYESVYDTYIPGFTPLEQAVAFMYKLKDIESHNNRRHAGQRATRNRVEFNRSDYADAILNNQLDLNRLNRSNKLEILNKISIMGDLGSQFKVEKGTGEKEVANSIYMRKKLMRSYDQIRMIEMYQRMLPSFRVKFLTKDLIVNVPVSTSEKKQKIIILLDYSGSMNDTSKQTWVNAILVDRFRYVIKGEAEVFISFFTSSIYNLDFKHIKNEEDVKEFWKYFSNSPGGSLTDIGKIVEYVAQEVKKGKLHNLQVDLSRELPEILIINDGQDEVNRDSFPYKVNAISLMQFSEELKRLCIASGGKQVKIRSSHDIVAYSSDGFEVIAE